MAPLERIMRSMRSTVVRDVRAVVADAARSADDPLALERVAAAQVRRVVPFDLWCGLMTDPGTGDVTGAFHDEGLPAHHLPRLVELETRQEERDFLALRDIVPGGETVTSLARATAGDLPSSDRYRDVLEPSGIRHEARWVLRGSDGRAWGAIVLMRASDSCDFTDDDLTVLSRMGRLVADGMRRVMVLGGSYDMDAAGPGLVLCRVTESIAVEHISATGRRWVEELDDGSPEVLPYSLASQVHLVHRTPSTSSRRVRVRSRGGRWLTAHLERLVDGSVSIILEPTRAQEMVDLVSDAFSLTSRERQVAALATDGLTNREIAETLFVSTFTVQDHLRAVYAKTGTRNRSELSAILARGAGGGSR